MTSPTDVHWLPIETCHWNLVNSIRPISFDSVDFTSGTRKIYDDEKLEGSVFASMIAAERRTKSWCGTRKEKRGTRKEKEQRNHVKLFKPPVTLPRDLCVFSNPRTAVTLCLNVEAGKLRLRVLDESGFPGRKLHGWRAARGLSVCV